MRIFSVIFLIILVSATASCTSGDAILIGMALTLHSTSPKVPSRHIEAPSNGFWFKPGTDIEQLKQDYSECGEIGYFLKGQKQCMREKGYTWATY